MILNAWRTLILESHESLSLRDNQILITEGEKETSIPMEYVTRRE